MHTYMCIVNLFTFIYVCFKHIFMFVKYICIAYYHASLTTLWTMTQMLLSYLLMRKPRLREVKGHIVK